MSRRLLLPLVLVTACGGEGVATNDDAGTAHDASSTSDASSTGDASSTSDAASTGDAAVPPSAECVASAGHVVWYVSKGAPPNGNGTSWSTAWSDTSTIAWTAVAPGDVVCLDGGNTGLSYSAFTTGKAGTVGLPITLRRSSESGHAGTVTIASPVVVNHSFVVLDGAAWGKIIVNGDKVSGAGTGGMIRINGATGTVIRHVKLEGTYAAGMGHSLSQVGGKDLTLDHVWFQKNAYEDHVFWQAGGLLHVTDSYFTMPNVPNDGSHRDGANPYTNNASYDVLVERTIFSDMWGFVFLFQDPAKIGSLTFRNDVFVGASTVVRFGSGNGGHGPVLFENDVFWNVQDTDFSGQVTQKNCIFGGKGPWSAGTVHSGAASLTYSLFDQGVGAFQAGTGNLQNGAAKFVNVASPLGADGVPFTADDGFRLQAGSAAIDTGTNAVTVTTDITSSPIVNGKRDMGAYEYGP